MGIIESYKLQEIAAIEDDKERENALARLKSHQDVGLCLGSQISQVMAMAVPNDFDHYIKDVLRFKYYERCMDDGVILFNDKKRLKEVLGLLRIKAAEVGLRFNENKTRVMKLTHGFTFLKVHYHIDRRGKTVKQLDHDNVVRERRRLKKLKPKFENGETTLDRVHASIQSWAAHAKVANTYATEKSMMKLYDKLFGGYKMTQKYFKAHPDEKRRKKVTRF